MFNRLSAEQSRQTSEILGRLDKIAANIQENFSRWGMDFDTAKEIVNGLDKTADEIEQLVFGPESLQRRQVELLKQAKVLQSDGDEPYMGTFNSPSAPIQTDADEPYMSAYGDDQSSAVRGGKDSAGKPLAK